MKQKTDGQFNIIMSAVEKPNPRKKILFMLPSLVAGGAERALITLMNNVDRNKFEPIFVVIQNKGPIKEWIANDIEFHSLDCNSLKFSYFKLLRLIRKTNPDVLFTTMVHCNALAILTKLFNPSLRVIVREAALPMSIIDNYGWAGKLCYFIYKYVYPFADTVICNSSQVMLQFSDTLKVNTKHYQLLYNPVDMSLLKVPEDASSIQERKHVQFVAIGRLSYEKGYDRLIEAIGQNFDPDFDWRLDIIGEGDYRPELEKLISKYEIQDQIKLVGYSPIPWKEAAFADCLLLPSRWEGMPNVALEALACGVPVIASIEAGGISDIKQYSNHGDVVIANNMSEFVQVMVASNRNVEDQAPLSKLPVEFSLGLILKKLESLLDQ